MKMLSDETSDFLVCLDFLFIIIFMSMQLWNQINMQTDQIEKNMFKIMNKTPRGHRFRVWNADVT